MTIQDLAKAASMNYNTVRKYYMILKDMNKVNRPEKSIVPILHQISQLTAQGKTVKEAIKKIYEEDTEKDVLQLKQQVEDLSNELSTLKILIRDYLPALGPGVKDTKKQGEGYVIEENKEGFFYYIKQAFKSLLPDKKKSGE